METDAVKVNLIIYINGLEKFLEGLYENSKAFNKEIYKIEGQLAAYKHTLELLNANK